MKIIGLLLSIALVATLSVSTPVDATPDTVAHSSSQNHDVCLWIAAANGAQLLAWYNVHGFGLHWVDCCIRFVGGYTLIARYLYGWGTTDWIAGDPRC